VPRARACALLVCICTRMCEITRSVSLCVWMHVRWADPQGSVGPNRVPCSHAHGCYAPLCAKMIFLSLNRPHIPTTESVASQGVCYCGHITHRMCSLFVVQVLMHKCVHVHRFVCACFGDSILEV
jgi:hypothetical protein